MAATIGFWSMITFPIFWSEAPIIKIGSHIAAGEPFKRTSLLVYRAQLDYLKQQVRATPESLHNVALIELRLAELESEAGDKIEGNAQFERAQNAIESAARSIPSDAFMWFALFWLTKTRDGMSERALAYLGMSYLVGPHEGWVAVRRNRFTVPLLAVLPKEQAEIVVAEFSDLVASGYIEPAADIITGPGWGHHERLLKGLINISEDSRRQLADAIYKLGFDVVVPGIEHHGQRPWR